MAVALFTLHAYGTWWPDHPRGYTHRELGVLPPDADKAEWFRQQAKFESVEFDAGMQRVLIAGAFDVCERRRWKLHAAGTDPTHGHFLISQPGYFDFVEVRDKLKNLLSLFLGRATGVTGRTWFAAGGSTKRVKDRQHFDCLVNKYLADQRGLSWKEGEALPEIADGIL